MKTILLIFSLLLINILIVNGKINGNVGVVEGFYWAQSDAVNGQYGSYSFSQRKLLIKLLSQNNLGVYWYCPQPPVNTSTMWTEAELSQWKDTAKLGSDVGVTVVYGIRPGWLSTDMFANITLKLKEVYSAGIRYYSLNFDDGEGIDNTNQQALEESLVDHLNTTLPQDMKIWGFTPYAYYKGSITSQEWVNALQFVDEVDSYIPFIFTGWEITPSNMNTSQFPTLPSGRSKKYWDNWVSVDTNTRIPWGLIDGRVESTIFQSPYGYILNLAYPLERVIHQIYCAGQLASGKNSCDVPTAANVWAGFLNANGFLHGLNLNNVTTDLNTAIEQDTLYNSITELEQAYPGLKDIFSTPPTIVESSSNSNSNSDSSVSKSSQLQLSKLLLLFICIITLF